MIIDFDDYPMHQTAASFDEAGTSDIRFFDRFWFSVMDPLHRFGLIAGLGVYKNMDVMDGFVSVSQNGLQSNVRVSRRLRPHWLPLGAGPLNVEIIAPMRKHRLTLQPNAHGISCDLILDATVPPFNVDHYQNQDRGWLEKDYRRLFQLARATGWVEAGGERFDSGSEGWPAGRDRSFGVRPGMGGTSPSRGKDLESGVGAHETLVIGAMFETAAHYGTWAVSEDAAGDQVYLSSTIHDRNGDETVITSLAHNLEFAPGALAYAGGTFDLVDGQGELWRIEVEPRVSFIYQGFGYINGWGDKRGLGAWRGDSAVEGDRYDLRDPANMLDESGRHVFGKHGMLHTQFDMRLNGRRGHGEGIALLMPQHPRYGTSSR
jgi:hypothetical protein